MLAPEFYLVVKQKLDHNTLTQDFVNGCETIAQAWLADGGGLTDRKLGYVLATTYHETAFTMHPLEEYGKGAGRKYGLPAENGNVYYGRGLVQLTWDYNYKKVGGYLNLPLYDTPSLACDLEVAAKILVLGMKQGWFTGKKLSDYNDFKDMRRIVNGMDKAATIAEYAEIFNAALKAGAGVVKDEGVVEVPLKPASQSTTIGAGGAIAIIEVARQAKEALETTKQIQGQVTDLASKLQSQSTLSLILGVIVIGLAAYVILERYKKPDIAKGGA
jgi:hypothetical protein